MRLGAVDWVRAFTVGHSDGEGGKMTNGRELERESK